MRSGVVPVLMFHSVRPRQFMDSTLSVPADVFASCMEALCRSGYTTIGLTELYQRNTAGRVLPEKPVVLTFDDGFLDNWSIAYPILKHYNLRATVFPALEFISEEPSRDQVKFFGTHFAQAVKENVHGSLSWDELKEMDSSGVFDVQSHTMTHDRFFTSPELVGFTGSGKTYDWMAWNTNPAEKPEMLESGSEKLSPGLPVWDFGRALGVRRFFPSKELESFLQIHLREELGAEYYRSAEVLELGNSIVKEWINAGKLAGRYESNDEMHGRIEYELLRSKELLESRLQKKIRFLCWPGGARTEKALNMSSSYGYLASTAPSSERTYQKNRPGESPSKIWRIGSCMRWSYRGRYGYNSPETFIAHLDRYCGSFKGYLRVKYYKAADILSGSGRDTIR